MKQDSSTDRYSIIRKIRAGGMATVFLVEDNKLHRTVALKKLHPHLIEHDETVIRFTNEAKAIASLSHENIIKIYDFGETADGPFLVMEYIDGTTLAEYIEKSGAVSNLITIEIACQIAAGLRCAHSNGIIHRDIKPANILIRKDGTVIITDFGIAYVAQNQSITITGSFLGSPHYVSPEQILGKTVTEKSDIYSLGIVLYQCLSGRMPFDADTPHAILNSIITCTPLELHESNPRVLYWFADLVMQCLSKDPQMRPAPEDLIECIRKKITDDSLVVTKSSIVTFLNEPAKSLASENTALFAAYRSRGIEELHAKRVIQGLRNLEQAEQFGNLSADDIRLKSYALKKSKKRPPLITHLSIVFIISIFISLLFTGILRGKKNSQTITQIPESTVAVLSITRPLSDSAAVVPTDTSVSSEDTQSLPVSEPKTEHISLPDPINTFDSASTVLIDTTQPDVNNQPAEGFLKILTNPPWVTIYIDGIERGKTPKTNSVALSKGKHRITLSKEGYLTFTDTISIIPPDTHTLRIRLQQEKQGDR